MTCNPLISEGTIVEIQKKSLEIKALLELKFWLNKGRWIT